MSDEHRSLPSIFTQVDISAGNQLPRPDNCDAEQADLLREMLMAQERTNTLLDELVKVTGAVQRQRAGELQNWKRANPGLARHCRRAAEVLSRVQIEYLDTITEEISSCEENLMEGEFMLNEFVDRFGPRLAHLNGMIQVLAQLSTVPNASDTPAQ